MHLPAWHGMPLILCIKNKSFDILKLLWTDVLSELWTAKHLEMVLDLLFQEQEWEVAMAILKEEVSRNLFISYGSKRHEFFQKYLEPLS